MNKEGVGPGVSQLAASPACLFASGPTVPQGSPHPLLSTPVTPIPVSLQQNLCLMRSLSEGWAAQTTLLKHEHRRQGRKADPRAETAVRVPTQVTGPTERRGSWLCHSTFSLIFLTLSCFKFSLNFSLMANMYFYFLINLVWLDFQPM